MLRYPIILISFFIVFGIVKIHNKHRSQTIMRKYNDTENQKIKKILVIMLGRVGHIDGISNRYKTMKEVLAKRGIQVDIMDSSDSDLPLNNLGYNKAPEDIMSFSLPNTYMKKYLSEMYDAIHIADLIAPQAFVSSRTFAYYGIPFSMMCHITYDHYNKSYGGLVPEEWYPYVIKFAARHAQKVFSPSKSMSQELRDKFGLTDSQMVELPNGINQNVFNTNKDESYFKTKDYLEKELGLKRPYLVCVSRVAPEKNLEEFFNLDVDGSKIMVGDGILFEQYKAKYPNVTFVGFKKGAELASYYKNADVFVFPSRTDTFGAVMIEAMGCGTPVAAYPCIGPIDVVDSNTTGILNDDLKEAVQQCLKLDRNTVLNGSKKYTWDNAVDIFINNLVYIPDEIKDDVKKVNSI